MCTQLCLLGFKSTTVAMETAIPSIVSESQESELMCLNLFFRLRVSFVTSLQGYKGIIWNRITDNHITQFYRFIQFKIVCVCVCMCVCMCVSCGNVDPRK